MEFRFVRSPVAQRCHSGRSQALVARGDVALALIDATEALTLAEAHLKRKAAAEAALKASSKGDAAPKPTSATSADVDPFSELPSISLAFLHYQRGLIHDALDNSSAALNDFKQSVSLEP